MNTSFTLNPAFRHVRRPFANATPGHPELVGFSLLPSDDQRDPPIPLLFHINRDEAEQLALRLLDAVSIQRYRDEMAQFHSCKESGMWNKAGSPQEGQSVCPPIRSCNTNSGEG